MKRRINGTDIDTGTSVLIARKSYTGDVADQTDVWLTATLYQNPSDGLFFGVAEAEGHVIVDSYTVKEAKDFLEFGSVEVFYDPFADGNKPAMKAV